MKKKLILSFLIIATLLIGSVSHAYAAADCEAFEKEEDSGENDIWYCVGGFRDTDHARDHEIVIDCPNCSSRGIRQIIPIDDFPDSSIGVSDNGTYTCIDTNSSFGGDIIEYTQGCVSAGGALENCLPEITITTQDGSDEWCSDEVPPELILAEIADSIILPLPSPTPEPLTGPGAGLTSETLDALNPLAIEGSDQKDLLSTPGGIVTRLLEFIFPLAGLVLFVMIIWGGFSMVAGARDKKSMEEGRNKVAAALYGFILLFASFWIIRLIESIFSLKIF